MRFLAAFVFWLFFNASAFAVISSSPIQQATGSGLSGTSFTVTISAASSGNTLIYVSGVTDSAQTISTISCTNVTWTKAQGSNTNADVEIWYGVVAGGSSGTTITVTTGATIGLAVRATVSEWSGVNTSSQLDVHATNSGTSTNPATGTITPTAGLNELFIAATREGGTFSSGPTNGWTAGTTPNTGFQWAYKVVSNTSGTDSTDWTYSASNVWDAAYATFKGPSGTTPSTSSRLLLLGFGQ